MNFEFEQLRSLLRRRADDADVVALIGQDPSIIERNEYYGSVEFKERGVDLVFKEAPWVVPPAEISNPKILHVCAFHFHSDGHEGYREYAGRFPGGVAFRDSEADVVHKLGEPLNSGGGGMSSLLKRLVPFWLRYSIDEVILHFQLDMDGRVEMATLYTEDMQQ